MAEHSPLISGSGHRKSYASSGCLLHDVEASYTEEIKLSWHNVNVYLNPKRGLCSSEKPNTKQILHNVNGEAHPGEVVAVMGASGAGKTTLFNVLTQRSGSDLKIDGQVLANDGPIGKSLISLSAYVQQDDLMFANLTVKEHLTFQSKLRMSRRYTAEERKQKVREVMRELGLTKCQNALIGGVAFGASKKGISGGERKRLAIASELLTNPALMFLDEPTSGLDTFMAEAVVTALKNLAQKGKTVLCTIHQPSSEIFALFDKVLLMAEGRLAYLGTKEDAHKFFKGLDLVCPIHYNPADFFIHSMAIRPGKEAECRKRVKEICDRFEESPLNHLKDRPPITYSDHKEEEAFAGRSMFKANWFTQFAALTGRAFLSFRRNKMLTIVSLSQVIIISTIVGLLYLDTKYDMKGIQNINGAIFLTLMQCSFPYIFPVINCFTPELKIFQREHWNGMYRTDVYFLGKIVAELPMYLILPLVFTTIVYWMIGLNPDPVNYLVFVGTCMLVVQASMSAGYLVSCIAPTVEVALGIAPPLLLPLILFGGIFLNAGSIPVYFVWLKYLSWFNYAYEIVIVNQWSGYPDLICDETTKNCQTGDMVVSSLNYSKDNIPLNFILLVTLVVGYRLLAFLMLALKSKKRA